MVQDIQIRNEHDLAQLLQAFEVKAAYEGLEFYCPHPKQEPFHRSQARERWFFTGNRFGKTYGCMVELLWHITKTHPKFTPIDNRMEKDGDFWRRFDTDPAWRGLKKPKPEDWPYEKKPSGVMRARIMCQDQDAIESTIIGDTLKKLIPLKYLKNKNWTDAYNKQNHLIHLEDGSYIQIKTYKQGQHDLQSLAGSALHYLHFDEEPSNKDIYDECITRLATTGGPITGCITPIKASNWVVSEIYEKADETPNIEIFRGGIEDNPYVGEQEIADLADRLKSDPEQADARLKGEFVWLKGRVFKQYSDVHFIRPIEIKNDWIVDIALDPHDSKPCYVTWGAWWLDAPGELPNLYIFRELLVSGTVDDICREVKANSVGMRIGKVMVDRSTHRKSQLIAGMKQPDNVLENFRLPYNYGNRIIPVGGDPQGRRQSINKYLALDPATDSPHLLVTYECPVTNRHLKDHHWKGPLPSGEDRSSEQVVKLKDDMVDNVGHILLHGPPVQEERRDNKPRYSWEGYAGRMAHMGYKERMV